MPVLRITLPDVPAPASRSLEEVYYKRSKDIVKNIKSHLNKNKRKAGN
jgi:pyruvate/2-oxoglutarate/acetoin dehydrogenase E1 component